MTVANRPTRVELVRLLNDLNLIVAETTVDSRTSTGRAPLEYKLRLAVLCECEGNQNGQTCWHVKEIVSNRDKLWKIVNPRAFALEERVLTNSAAPLVYHVRSDADIANTKRGLALCGRQLLTPLWPFKDTVLKKKIRRCKYCSRLVSKH